jgi:RNA polymerase sigma factor (sigma-70 family)
MSDAPDTELLEQFARNQSEAAFAELVQRHIGLVHSVALRHTANPEQAQDITQAVFIILSRKAASLGPKVVLPGWLYHTVRLTAANFQRAEMRRIHREQEAFMQSTLEEPASDALWRELSPKTLAALQEPLMFPPRVPVLTDITDYRLRNQANPFRAVFYKTDQAFKTEAEVQKLPKNQKLELYTATRKVVRPVADSSSHIIRNALIAVFLAFSGTALFLFLRKPGQGLPSRR